MARTAIPALLTLVLVSAVAGCSAREIATGAAVGAGAYEYSNKRAMDAMEEDYRSGEITREQYERRREQIEERSVVY